MYSLDGLAATAATAFRDTNANKNLTRSNVGSLMFLLSLSRSIPEISVGLDTSCSYYFLSIAIWYYQGTVPKMWILFGYETAIKKAGSTARRKQWIHSWLDLATQRVSRCCAPHFGIFTLDDGLGRKVTGPSRWGHGFSSCASEQLQVSRACATHSCARPKMVAHLAIAMSLRGAAVFLSVDFSPLRSHSHWEKEHILLLSRNLYGISPKRVQLHHGIPWLWLAELTFSGPLGRTPCQGFGASRTWPVSPTWRLGKGSLLCWFFRVLSE